VLADTEVACPTWLALAAENNINSNCSLCPAPLIENCVTQSGDQCLECAEGYSVTELKDFCLEESCASVGKDSLPDGTCVDTPSNCEPGMIVSSGTTEQVHCTKCLPGFNLVQGSCVALPDPENCAEIEMTNPRKCIVCEEGYSADSNGQCQEEKEEPAACEDSDNGATDPYGDGCAAYNNHPNWCGG